MRNAFALFVLTLLFASCAELREAPYKTIRVHTTTPVKIIYKSDTISTVNNRADITLRKTKQPVTITAITDSLEKPVTIKPIPSIDHYFKTIVTYGIYLLIKKQPQKRTYPANIYINTADTLNRYSTYPKINRKSELHLQLSLPFVNTFLLKPKGESVKSNTGYASIGAGLNYFHQNNQFLNLSAYVQTDAIFAERFGEYESMNSISIALSNNHVFNRFSIGYGIAYARNEWSYIARHTVNPARKIAELSARALGVVIPISYQVTPHFYVGAAYRPTFINLTAGGKSQYEHLISVEVAWKIRLKNGR
jgi:hypothetical protein